MPDAHGTRHDESRPVARRSRPVTGSGLRKRDVLDMMKGHRAEAGVWLDEVVRTGQPARSLRRRTPVTVLRTCGHGSGHQWVATVTRVFGEGAVHHPTVAGCSLGLGSVMPGPISASSTFGTALTS